MHQKKNKKRNKSRSRSRDKKSFKKNQKSQILNHAFINKDNLNYIPTHDNFNLNMNMIPYQHPYYLHPQNSLKESNNLYYQNPSLQQPLPNNQNKAPEKIPLDKQFPYKHARRLYVGNIPQGITKQQLSKWLYSCLQVAGGIIGEGNPVSSILIDFRGRFAFVELRSIEETSAAFMLDGIFLVLNINQWNKQLRIRRPTEYSKFPKVEGTREVPMLNLKILQSNNLQIIPTEVQNGPLKMYLANLPVDMDETSLIENLDLKTFGQENIIVNQNHFIQ